MIPGLYYRASQSLGPILFLLLSFSVAGGAKAADSAAKVDFAHTIVPILKKHCVECHGGRRHEGEFSINTREEIPVSAVTRVRCRERFQSQRVANRAATTSTKYA